MNHGNTDLRRQVSALQATEAALLFGVAMISGEIVSLPIVAYGLFAEGLAVLEGDWLVRDYADFWLTAAFMAAFVLFLALRYAVLVPLTYFALTSMRPLLLIAAFTLLFGWALPAILVESVLRGQLVPAEGDYYSSQESALGASIFGIIALAVLCTLFVRAPLAVLSCSQHERGVARLLPPAHSYPALLRSMFGIWPHLKRHRLATLGSTLIMYASIVCTSFSIIIPVSTLIYLALTLHRVFSEFAAAGDATALTTDLKFALVVLVGGAIAEVLAVRSAPLLRTLARSVSRQSLDRQIERDKRPPILFLRSFADDQVTLPKYGFWGGILRGEAGSRRLDHLLVENFTRHGPVIAIGRPGEKSLPFGAARKYVTDDKWQTEVRALANQAAHIVVVADSTEGVAWEIETTLLEPILRKTLFLAAPSQGDLRLNPRIRKWASENVDITTGSGVMIGIFSTREGGVEALYAVPSADAYQIALQAFFRRQAVESF